MLVERRKGFTKELESTEVGTQSEWNRTLPEIFSTIKISYLTVRAPTKGSSP